MSEISLPVSLVIPGALRWEFRVAMPGPRINRYANVDVRFADWIDTISAKELLHRQTNMRSPASMSGKMITKFYLLLSRSYYVPGLGGGGAATITKYGPIIADTDLGKKVQLNWNW